jgi:nitrogen-specific signal transduction histidine kinase
MREQGVEEAGGQERQVESTLRKDEWQFHRFLERLPAGAYTCDSEGLITYFNQQAVQLWGREPKINDPADRFCGSFKLFSTDGLPLAHDQCWMAMALRLGKGYNAQEIVIERPDGQRLTALAHANPIYNESGKLLGAVNVLLDITARKQAEAVARANDRAAAAERAASEFLSTMSHELRTPLNIILGYLDLVLDDESERLSPKQSHRLGRVRQSALELLALISTMLDLSCLETGRLPTEE